MGLEFPPYIEEGSDSWAALTGKPTTIAGFGITDALPQGGPLTEDLDFNGSAAENVGTMTAAYIVGVSGGYTSLDGDLVFTDGSGSVNANTFVVNGVGYLLGQSGLTFDGANYATVMSGTSGILLMTNGDVTDAVFNGQLGTVGTALFGVVDTPSGGSGQLLMTDGDASNMSGTIGISQEAIQSNADGAILHGTDNSSSGIAAFQSDGSLAQATIANIQSLLNDSGWTANADAGDKTVVIGSTASLTTIATALNLVSAGAGTALLNIAQKVKAIESALSSGLFPNQ